MGLIMLIGVILFGPIYRLWKRHPPSSAGFFMEGMKMDFKGAALPLRDGDVETIAGYLGCEVAVLRAVMQVESAGRAFQDGRPVILNEPHIFYRQLGAGQKRNDAAAKGLAYYRWRTKPYPRTQDARYAWLEKSMKIDAADALKSCSWGLGQVMGFNYRVCGFDDVFAFVEAMKHSEGAQLMVIARFIVGNRLQRHLRSKNWRGFAKGYNGSGYAKNGYHTKLANAYRQRPASEKTIPPVPPNEALSVILGNAAPQPAPEPVSPPPPPDIPKPDDTPSQPPQGGFFVRLLQWLFGGPTP
jgi:hypothetical protein